jgi:eukaryotic-like serine/threonine-protein kinase
LLVALEGVVSAASVPPARYRKPSRILSSVVGLVLLPSGLILGLSLVGQRGRILKHNAPNAAAVAPAASEPIKVRRSVAVMGFQNLSGRPEEAWLSTALSEMLTTELAAGEKLRTVPGENVAQMKIDLSLPDADSYGQETLQEIHKNLNADNVVLGSYIPLGKDRIRPICACRTPNEARLSWPSPKEEAKNTSMIWLAMLEQNYEKVSARATYPRPKQSP